MIDNNQTTHSWNRLIFCYTGGEKTILTLDIEPQQIRDLAIGIANSESPYVVLDIGTSKDDIILVNKDKFLFMMSTHISEEEAMKTINGKEQVTTSK